MRPAAHIPRTTGSLGLTLLFLVGCGRAPAPPVAAALRAPRIVEPVEASLEIACTPTGPELCFNATDDNCNGVIDEGCGISTGLLHVAVAWTEPAADVDVLLTTPSGERVSDANRATPSGFRLDRDCPRDDCHGQNVENIVFEGSDPPRGDYVVEVRLSDLHGAPSPVKVHLGVRIGPRTFGARVRLSRSEDRQAFRLIL